MVNRVLKKRQEEIRRTLSQVIEFETRDPRIGFVTVMGVELSRDMRHAKVYLHIPGDEAGRDEALTAFREHAGFFRSELADRLALRHTPELDFRLDETVERAGRIEQLLKEMEAEEEWEA